MTSSTSIDKVFEQIWTDSSAQELHTQLAIARYLLPFTIKNLYRSVVLTYDDVDAFDAFVGEPGNRDFVLGNENRRRSIRSRKAAAPEGAFPPSKPTILHTLKLRPDHGALVDQFTLRTYNALPPQLYAVIRHRMPNIRSVTLESPLSVSQLSQFPRLQSLTIDWSSLPSFAPHVSSASSLVHLRVGRTYRGAPPRPPGPPMLEGPLRTLAFDQLGWDPEAKDGQPATFRHAISLVSLASVTWLSINISSHFDVFNHLLPHINPTLKHLHLYENVSWDDNRSSPRLEMDIPSFTRLAHLESFHLTTFQLPTALLPSLLSLPLVRLHLVTKSGTSFNNIHSLVAGETHLPKLKELVYSTVRGLPADVARAKEKRIEEAAAKRGIYARANGDWVFGLTGAPFWTYVFRK
ncbi:hypothetical protein MNV49_001725 [Pseudohyphozyma bogoriensis]|nr:hypothetical protein MNV49_001725 [Pseudohyphozyma bogoriensis]